MNCTKASLLAVSTLAAFSLPVSAINADDHTIRPGVGLGSITLGMTAPQVRKISGNMDGRYNLASGVKVEYAEWREKPPKVSPNLRFFYGRDGKLCQLNSAAPVPKTADGISCKSTLGQISAAYPKLQTRHYRCGAEVVDYYDSLDDGIAFRFTAKKKPANQLYAIIVHRPGVPVLADANEKPI